LATRRTITGFSNPLVKFLRSLREKKHRKREKRFLAEGLRLLTDARECGKVPEILVMATGREPHPLLDALEDAVDKAGGDIVEMDVDILAKVTGKDNPQAVAGVFAEFDTSLSTIDRTAAPIWLVAQALRDPGNLGTMLRTGDAVGAGGLILIDDCADPFSVEAVRASMGSIFDMPFATASFDQFNAWRKRLGLTMSAASVNGTARHDRTDFTSSSVIIMGNEQSGLPPEAETACDQLCLIPMRGGADSLNLAQATAIMTYEAWRQRDFK